jgi:hypothetical protein
MRDIYTAIGKFDSAIVVFGCSIVITNIALNDGSSKQGLNNKNMMIRSLNITLFTIQFMKIEKTYKAVLEKVGINRVAMSDLSTKFPKNP